MQTSRIIAGVAASALVAVPLAADAAGGPAQRAGTAVTLGSTEGPINSCGDVTAVLSGTAPGGPVWASPIDGVITSWRHAAGPNVGKLRVLVVRPSTITPGGFTIVGKSASETITPNVFNTFAARVPISAGQQLGIDVDATGNVFCAILAQSSDVFSAALDVDTTTTTEFKPDFSTPGARLNLSAVVEPDADRDGFGDVSQDQCPQSSATQAACPAPDTTVTKAPRRTTTKRKVKIAFTSNQPGASFTCALDRKAPVACSSPFTTKVKIGKHTVVVTAISGLGVPDPAPATVKFKVRRP